MSTVQVVAVGASLGGLRALQKLLHGLPAALDCSVVIAQHRRADVKSPLCDLLASACSLPVLEPEDRTPLRRGHIYVAPSDYHMLVEPGMIVLSIDPPVRHARPSIDVLFESVADAYGPASLAVMLTSSNEDGADGAAAIARAGGRVIVQDPRSAESPVGPGAVMAAAQVHAVLQLEQIAGAIARLVAGPMPPSHGEASAEPRRRRRATGSSG